MRRETSSFVKRPKSTSVPTQFSTRRIPPQIGLLLMKRPQFIYVRTKPISSSTKSIDTTCVWAIKENYATHTFRDYRQFARAHKKEMLTTIKDSEKDFRVFVIKDVSLCM